MAETTVVVRAAHNKAKNVIGVSLSEEDEKFVPGAVADSAEASNLVPLVVDFALVFQRREGTFPSEGRTGAVGDEYAGDVEALTAALSDILTHYPPAAGRLARSKSHVGRHRILCTNAGVPFTAAVASSAPSDAGRQAIVNDKFFDPIDASALLDGNEPLMRVKWTTFGSGSPGTAKNASGAILAVSFARVLCDVGGMAKFMRGLAVVLAGRKLKTLPLLQRRRVDEMARRPPPPPAESPRFAGASSLVRPASSLHRLVLALRHAAIHNVFSLWRLPPQEVAVAALRINVSEAARIKEAMRQVVEDMDKCDQPSNDEAIVAALLAALDAGAGAVPITRVHRDVRHCLCLRNVFGNCTATVDVPITLPPATGGGASSLLAASLALRCTPDQPQHMSSGIIYRPRQEPPLTPPATWLPPLKGGPPPPAVHMWIKGWALPQLDFAEWRCESVGVSRRYLAGLTGGAAVAAPLLPKEEEPLMRPVILCLPCREVVLVGVAGAPGDVARVAQAGLDVDPDPDARGTAALAWTVDVQPHVVGSSGTRQPEGPGTVASERVLEDAECSEEGHNRSSETSRMLWALLSTGLAAGLVAAATTAAVNSSRKDGMR